jgi:hypothetical protein
MADKYNFAAFFDFLGGQNSAAAPDNLRDDEMQNIENFDPIIRGALKNRPGTAEVAWDFSLEYLNYKIDRIAEYPKTNGTILELILTNGNLYLKGYTTPLLSAVGTHMDTTVYQDKIYILINSKYYVFDGTTIAEVTKAVVTDNNLTTIAKCKYIVSRGEKIYASGNPDAPTALYYSQVGDPTYFKTGDFQVFANSGDGDAISGLHEYQSTLIVFKSKGLWKYEGVSAAVDAQFTRLNAESGTKAYRTIRDIGNFVFFLGVDGVYAIKTTQTGVVVTEKVTSAVSNLFTNVQYAASWHNSSAVAAVYEGKYVLSYSIASITPTVNTEVMVCHMSAGLEKGMTPWTRYKGLSISEMLKSIDGTLYMGDATRQEIFKFDPTKLSDRGTQMNYKLVTKDYDLDSPVRLKKIKRGWLIFRQYEEFESTIDMSIVVDYTTKLFQDQTATESLVWDKGTWGVNKWGWIDTFTLPFRIGKKGIRARAEITAYSTDDFENEIFIYGFAFMYRTKKPYK